MRHDTLTRRSIGTSRVVPIVIVIVTARSVVIGNRCIRLWRLISMWVIAVGRSNLFFRWRISIVVVGECPGDKWGAREDYLLWSTQLARSQYSNLARPQYGNLDLARLLEHNRICWRERQSRFIHHHNTWLSLSSRTTFVYWNVYGEK